jgi:uncharacterized OsmC-like protein
MNYSIEARSIAGNDASLLIKKAEIKFGTTDETAANLPNPAELFLGAFSSCILKNIERFSVLLKFEYRSAEIKVTAVRLDHPPRLDKIEYQVKVYSNDQRLNLDLLKKNVEKFGTIYNTVKSSCEISGKMIRVEEHEL